MEWMMAHPWMTFSLALAEIETVGNVVVAVCSAITASRGSLQDRKGLKKHE